jgi:hypothetical protein
MIERILLERYYCLLCDYETCDDETCDDETCDHLPQQ